MGEVVDIEVKSGDAEADKAFMDVFAAIPGLTQTPTGFMVSPELVSEHGAEQVVAAIEAPLHRE